MNPLKWLTSLLRKEQPDLPKHGDEVPTGMTRRGFLQILGGSAAVAVAAPLVDLEALVWAPSPTIVVPELRTTLLTADWITREAMRVMKNQLDFVKSVNRHYDEQFMVSGVVAGDSFRVSNRARTKFVNSRTLGHRGMNHMLGVDFDVPKEPVSKEEAIRLAEGAGVLLAHRALEVGVTAFGLPAGIPNDGESGGLEVALAMSSPDGVAMRGTRGPAVDTPNDRIRLDILVAGR